MRIKSFVLPLIFNFVVIGSLFFFVNTVFGGGITVPGNTGLPYPTDQTGGEGPVADVIFFFLSWILSVFMLLAVLAFVITGIQYLMAFGDTYKAETAKKNFTYSIIAVTAVGGAFIIIWTINAILDS